MATFTKLGKYTIRRELGKGAMGVVYEGFDPQIERTVAIKTILPQQLGGDDSQNVMARFKREAQAAGRLNHPGIVAVYDYGEEIADDDRTMVAGVSSQEPQRVAYIAMEFVQGRELRDYFEANERFGLPEVARLMGLILDALAHAHAHGVVHRDMKPANLIVLPDGKVKIADFGIARVEKSELTQLGTIMGTPAYMSPEQFMGQPVDGRSDIFSCGVILYQFLTGEKPFTGNSTTIMFKVLHEEPLAPSMLNVALPSAFDAVVRKAMAKNPDERYQSAQEFAQAIQTSLQQPTHTPQSSANATLAFDLDSTLVNAGSAIAPKQATSTPPLPPPPVPPIASDVGNTGKPAAKRAGLIAAAVAGAVVLGAGSYALLSRTPGSAELAASSTKNTSVAPADSAQAAPKTVATEVAAVPVLESGTMVISALGLVDPRDARFQGDAGAAQAESRADAMRQLVAKAVALYVNQESLNKNYATLDRKLLSQSGSFIKTVIHEGSATAGKDGLIETEARAVVRVRDVQKSLNQLSKEERIEFIRNNGDPKVSIVMSIRDADTAKALPGARSAVAENVLKERIKSFGFRVWSADGELPAGASGQTSDFQIEGEVKLKLLSTKLPASGLTITKSALTSWTIKAIDKSTGEEVYLNTVHPSGKSWASEDLALAEVGKLVGDTFSKQFFLDRFNYSSQKINLHVNGLPDAASAKALLRELRGFRHVLDAQMLANAASSTASATPNPTANYQLQLASGIASDLILEGVLKPLNAKLGQTCLVLGGATGVDVQVNFAPACQDAAVQSRWISAPPAGLQSAVPAKGLGAVASKNST